jgi:hypothetical protein
MEIKRFLTIFLLLPFSVQSSFFPCWKRKAKQPAQIQQAPEKEPAPNQDKKEAGEKDVSHLRLDVKDDEHSAVPQPEKKEFTEQEKWANQLETQIRACNEENIRCMLKAFPLLINLHASSGLTPIKTARTYNPTETNIIKLLLNHKADVHVKPKISQEMILANKFEAEIQAKNEENVRAMLKDNSWLINFHASSGLTPIAAAARINDPNAVMVRFLLDNKADVNLKSKSDDPPLTHAVHWGSFEAMQLIIEQKADLEARNRHGENAMGSIAWKIRYTDGQALMAYISPHMDEGRLAHNQALIDGIPQRLNQRKLQYLQQLQKKN